MHAVAHEHRLRSALVLHLDHRALVLLVRTVVGLRHDAVESGALELLEPTLRLGRVVGRAGEEQRIRVRQVGEHRLEPCAALGVGQGSEILVAQCEQVESDHLRGRLGGQLLDARGRRVNPLTERVPVEALRARLAARHDDLRVENDPLRQNPEQVLHHLGEVARERLRAA